MEALRVAFETAVGLYAVAARDDRELKLKPTFTCEEMEVVGR